MNNYLGMFFNIKTSFLFIIYLFVHSFSFSQNIEGKIVNFNNEAISFASVVVKDTINNKILNYTYSNEKGDYFLELNKKGNYTLLVSAIGYEKKKLILVLPISSSLNIKLKEKLQELEEVIVQSAKTIEVKKDTVVFNAKSFLKGNEQAVEDLLKNIPGLNVSNDGTIKVGNQEIEKVMVEGDDFFEKGYKILTKNMPTDPIKKVEILKRYSNNKHLKGIENSKKVALNLVLKEKAKRVWFGNARTGYGMISSNRYDVQGNLMNFGKKNKYYFLTNLNNTGADATGAISNLINPYNLDDIAHIGDNQKIDRLFSLNSFIPSFKASRTNFNNDELFSLNTILNPTKRLKIKTLVFFNSDENDFFRNSVNSFQINNASFINTENYFLRKKKYIGFGKINFIYDISKDKSVEFISKINYQNQKGKSNLIFNNQNTIEAVDDKNTLIDQKVVYTNKLDKHKVLLITGRYIFEKLPQNYTVNTFLYKDLFPTINSDNVLQSYESKMNFSGIEAHLLDRKKNKNLLQIQIGNTFREDILNSILNLKQDDILVSFPENYRNNAIYLTNDLYAKGSYLLKIKNISLEGKLGIHQLYNRYKSQNKSIEQYPLFINPKLEFEWEINPNNTISSKVSFNNTNAGIVDVFDNYILTDYRSFNKGIGDLSKTQASTFTFNYQLGNWGDKFFANTFILYNKYHDFFSTNSFIEPNYVQSEKILMKDKEMMSIFSNVNRYFKSISSNIKLEIGYSSSNYKNIVNYSGLREVLSKNYNFGVELRSGFNGFFNYHLGSKWTTNTIKTVLKNTFTNNNTFLDLSFAFNKKFNLDIQTERYKFGNLNKLNNTYYFADFRAIYKINSPKIVVSLTGKNLFNVEKFQEFSINDNGSSMTNYSLLPRYVLLKLEYRF